MKDLLSDFSKVSKEAWKEKIIADLRGKSFDELSWAKEGLEGGPIYASEDLANLSGLSATQNNAVASNPTVFGSRYWVNYQEIIVEDPIEANKEALSALNAGADGLLFRIDDIPNLEQLLKDIQPEYCAISFEAKDNPNEVLGAYQDYLQSMGLEAKQFNGFISTSNSPSPLNGFRSLNIRISDELNQASVVQELGWLLHRATSVISDLVESGSSLESIVSNLQFELRLGDHYFIEIAKVRALRVLATSMLKGFDYDISSKEIYVLSASDQWNEDVEDEYNYLLKGTIQAMSAIIGGCNALLLRPFHSAFKNDSELAKRNARNISSILKDESYLDKVVDPSAGSYFIESITYQLIAKAWNLFLALEKHGSGEISLPELDRLTSKVSES